MEAVKDYAYHMKISKEQLMLYLTGQNIRSLFTIDNISEFIDSLELRSRFLFKTILEYKLMYSPLKIRIRKSEYKLYLKGKFPMPLDICTILVRSSVDLPLDDLDYVAAWTLLIALENKCSFLSFDKPKVQIES